MRVKSRSAPLPTGDLGAYFLSEQSPPSLEAFVVKICPSPLPTPVPVHASFALARLVLARLDLPLDDSLASAVLDGCTEDTLEFFAKVNAPRNSVEHQVVVLESEVKPLRQRPSSATATLHGTRMSASGTRGRKRPATAK